MDTLFLMNVRVARWVFTRPVVACAITHADILVDMAIENTLEPLIVLPTDE